jgi:hypothetical protein
MVRLPDGSGYDFNALPNDWVKVRLDYPTMKPLPKSAPAQANELWITAHANPHDFEFLKKIYFGSCIKVGEPNGGVSTYKHGPSKTEQGFSCRIGDGYKDYIVTNNSGQDKAHFTCSDWIKGNIRISWHGTVAFPDTSIATVNIGTTNKAISLEELKTVTQFVDRFITQATVKRGKIREYEVYSNKN